MPKKIIGLTGEIASGKGAAADYLIKKHQASACRFSDPLRECLNLLRLDITRENLQNLSSLLRERFGQDIFSKIIADKVKNDKNKLIVIDGIRRPADVICLRRLPGFILVYVTADEKTRYDRLIKRGENGDETKKTFRQFMIDSRAETERLIAEIGQAADYRLNNNGSLKSLCCQIDDILAK